eukprot:3702105-Rhodomonas_salina.1
MWWSRASCEQGCGMWTVWNVCCCCQCCSLAPLVISRTVRAGQSTLSLLTPVIKARGGEEEEAGGEKVKDV